MKLDKVTRGVGNAASIAVGLGLVILGVQLGDDGTQAHAAAADLGRPYYAPGEMPEFPGSIEQPLGEGLALNGVPLRLSFFEARRSAEEVAEFYSRQLETRGLIPRVVPEAGVGCWAVSAIAEDGQSQVVIAILGRGARRSLVFPSIVPLVPTSSPSPSSTLGLPQSGAAFGTLTVTSQDPSGGILTSWQEPNETAMAAATRIRKQLEDRGWRASQAEPRIRGAVVVEVQKDGRRARFDLTPWPQGAQGVAVSAFFSGEGESP